MGSEELKKEIAEQERRLADLRAEVEQRTSRLAALREKVMLSAEEVKEEPVSVQASSVCAPGSDAERIALFRSLFRGRGDVFARRWSSQRTGHSGYVPACANEWVDGVCGKKNRSGKRLRCSECPNRLLLPITDERVAEHLKGDVFIGIYPLLPDETCHLLAIDFDGHSWQDDVAAFAETCCQFSMPAAIERSRSGQGAHVWFFFTSCVEACLARRLGSFLITQTIARRHELSMKSYDRLFPNQNTLPRGGFGNLIALPLQGRAIEQGNSVFLDHTFTSLRDQWEFLASVRRVEPASIRAVLAEMGGGATGTGGERPVPATEDTPAPWDPPLSGRPSHAAAFGPMPSEVHATLAQKLFLEKRGLPSALLAEAKRLAVFQNPEFYKRQSLRLSTARTPRLIVCFEDLPEHVALPRGFLSGLEVLLREQGGTLVVDDKRARGEALGVTFQGTLSPTQEQAAQALLENETGVFVAPSGLGKTVVGIYLVAARQTSTLVLVHRKPLLDQWVSQLSVFLGLPSKEIGQIGGGRSKPNGRLDVAMFQSLVRKGNVNDLVRGYGQVIVDECHHCPSVSFERVVSKATARYVVGLTATPRRRDGHDPIIRMQLGPVRFKVDAKRQAARRPFAHWLVVRETGFQLPTPSGDLTIQELYSALAADEERNALIVGDVAQTLKNGRSPIVLTERREHLNRLAEELRAFSGHVAVLHGRMRVKKRQEVMAQLAAAPDGKGRVVLATGRYIGEGFDDARLDTLFLALPVSWRGTLEQYVGRLHRLHPGKTEVRVYDYVDSEVEMLSKMWKKRLRGYQAMGYTREGGDLGALTKRGSEALERKAVS